MLGLVSTNRHRLKYLVARSLLDQSLPQSSCKSLRAKSATTSTVPKPTITKTKKKYSELPTLNAPCGHSTDAVPGSQGISHTHLAPHTSECASFAYNERLWPSVNIVIIPSCFIAAISNSPLTASQQSSWSEIEPIPVESSPTQVTRRRRVRRVKAGETSGVPEPEEQSKSTVETENAAARTKRRRKALPPTPTGESCEWQ